MGDADTSQTHDNSFTADEQTSYLFKRTNLKAQTYAKLAYHAESETVKPKVYQTQLVSSAIPASLPSGWDASPVTGGWTQVSIDADKATRLDGVVSSADLAKEKAYTHADAPGVKLVYRRKMVAVEGLTDNNKSTEAQWSFVDPDRANNGYELKNTISGSYNSAYSVRFQVEDCRAGDDGLAQEATWLDGSYGKWLYDADTGVLTFYAPSESRFNLQESDPFYRRVSPESGPLLTVFVYTGNFGVESSAAGGVSASADFITHHYSCAGDQGTASNRDHTAAEGDVFMTYKQEHDVYSAEPNADQCTDYALFDGFTSTPERVMRFDPVMTAQAMGATDLTVAGLTRLATNTTTLSNSEGTIWTSFASVRPATAAQPVVWLRAENFEPGVGWRSTAGCKHEPGGAPYLAPLVNGGSSGSGTTSPAKTAYAVGELVVGDTNASAITAVGTGGVNASQEIKLERTLFPAGQNYTLVVVVNVPSVPGHYSSGINLLQDTVDGASTVHVRLFGKGTTDNPPTSGIKLGATAPTLYDSDMAQTAGRWVVVGVGTGGAYVNGKSVGSIGDPSNASTDMDLYTQFYKTQAHVSDIIVFDRDLTAEEHRRIAVARLKHIKGAAYWEYHTQSGFEHLYPNYWDYVAPLSDARFASAGAQNLRTDMVLKTAHLIDGVTLPDEGMFTLSAPVGQAPAEAFFGVRRYDHSGGSSWFCLGHPNQLAYPESPGDDHGPQAYTLAQSENGNAQMRVNDLYISCGAVPGGLYNTGNGGTTTAYFTENAVQMYKDLTVEADVKILANDSNIAHLDVRGMDQGAGLITFGQSPVTGGFLGYVNAAHIAEGGAVQHLTADHVTFGTEAGGILKPVIHFPVYNPNNTNPYPVTIERNCHINGDLCVADQKNLYLAHSGARWFFKNKSNNHFTMGFSNPDDTEDKLYTSNTSSFGDTLNWHNLFSANKMYSTNYVSAASYTTRSDSRLKENVQPANTQLCYDSVKNTALHTYTYIPSYAQASGKSGRVLGWIADEVETSVQDAVASREAPIDYGAVGDGEGPLKTIDQVQMVKNLWGAVQTLMQKVEALEAREAARVALE